MTLPATDDSAGIALIMVHFIWIRMCAWILRVWLFTHRLRVYRMHSKQYAGQCGEIPAQTGHNAADVRKQQTGNGVHQYVGHMEPAAVASEECMIEPSGWKKKDIDNYTSRRA